MGAGGLSARSKVNEWTNFYRRLEEESIIREELNKAAGDIKRCRKELKRAAATGTSDELDIARGKCHWARKDYEYARERLDTLDENVQRLKGVVYGSCGKARIRVDSEEDCERLVREYNRLTGA